MQGLGLVGGILLALLSMVPLSGHAGELQISGYGGYALTTDTDVELERPGGTDLRFEDVAFPLGSTR